MEIITIKVVMYPDGRMNTTNAAKYLGMSKKSLAMWRCQGTGPKFVKRGLVFYFKEDLDSWIQEGRCSSTAQSNFNKKKIFKL